MTSDEGSIGLAYCAGSDVVVSAGQQRGKEAGPAGLGFGASEDAQKEMADDPFSQYRKKRSGFYHDSLSRAQAAAEARLQAAA